MKLKNWFRPAVLKMQGYTPGEQPKGFRLTKLNTNENPYRPSVAVLKAVRDSAGSGLRLYPEPTADTLRETLSKTYRWPVEGILVGNGSDEIFSILFRAAVGKGDVVQYPDVTYSLYPVLAEMAEARVKEVKLSPDFTLDFKKLSPQARLTLFAYPNAPIGNCFPQKELQAFCRKAKGLVLIDEAYVDFADQTCLSFAKKYPNVLVLRTLSKSFSLAGARLGYVFAHPAVVGQLMKVKDSYNVNRVTQAIGLAAFSPQGMKEMKANVRRIQQEREYLSAALRTLGFKVPESQANFILALRPDGKSAEEFYKNLKKRGVLVRYFPLPRLRNSIRITVGTPEQNDRLLTELQKFLKKG